MPSVIVTAQKFNNFVHGLATGSLNFNTDNLYVILTNTAPVATNTLYSDISGNELPNGNGYTTGGIIVPTTGTSNTSGTETIVGGVVTFVASGGNIGPFRYVVLYDKTSGYLVEFWNYGSSITLLGASAGFFTWTPSGSVLLTLS